MKRSFWFAAGAGVGVYAMSKARRVAETFTPEGLADRLAGVSAGLRIFGDEVKAGMADKENDVRERLGVRLPVTPGRHAAELGPSGTTAATAPGAERVEATREGTH
jgi:hypothetical protein